LGLPVAGKVGSLRQVWSLQAVGVFLRSSLPGAVRITEVITELALKYPGESSGRHLQRTPTLTVTTVHLKGYDASQLRIFSESAWMSSKKIRSRVWVGAFTVT